MNSLLRTLSLLVIMWSATISFATSLVYNFVYYYPPGGGQDIATSPLIKYMERNNIQVNKMFFKTCTEAIAYATTNFTPSYLVVFDDDFQNGGTGPCPNIESLPSRPKLITNLTSSTLYLCTAPNKSSLTVSDLTRGKHFIGMSSNPVRHFNELKNSISYYGLIPIPYDGTGKLKTSLAGTDLDFFYATGIVTDMIERGATCLLSSTKVNSFNLPFIGTVFPKANEMPVTNTLWGNSAITGADIVILKEALRSPEFTGWISKQKVATHEGIGKF